MRRSWLTRILVAVLALHVLVACWGFDNDPLVAAVACGGAVVFAFAAYASARGAFFAFIVPLGFVWWNNFTLCYMNLAYAKLTHFPLAGDHSTTAWLTALMGASAAVGAIGMAALLGPPPPVRPPSSIVRSWQAFAVTGAVFAMIAVTLVLTGLLDARFNVDLQQDQSRGATYIANGLSVLVYVFFFVSGTRVVQPVTSVNNFAIAMVVAVPAVSVTLTGGRGPTLFMIMLAVGGAAWAGLPRRQIAATGCVVASAWLVLAMIIHDARGQRGFGEGSVSDRVEIMGASARTINETSTSEDDNPLDNLIGRLFEPSAIVVVNQTRSTQRFAGFANFDRLQLMFVPTALAPDKLPTSDGRETLINEFGFNLGRLTSIPITLVGDAYRRGGEGWVAAVGFLVGLTLLLLSRWTLRLLGNDFGVVFIAVYLTQELALHGESVLGCISALTYYWTKHIILFFIMSLMIKQLIAITTPLRPATWSAAESKPAEL